MSGIEAPIFNCATRVQITFQDDIGNTRTPSGSGFWVTDSEKIFFVTNRHNIDATLKLGADTKFQCKKIEIQMRRIVNGQASNIAHFFEVSNMDCITLHPNADIAILVNPLFTTDISEYGYAVIKLEEIADAAFFNASVKPFDIASFIGYPGPVGIPLWDMQWALPVGRSVNIASLPTMSFTNPNIPTTDVVLVSGLSFSGSSGSPVMLHKKGLTGDVTTPDYAPSKLIGIMSGHMWNEKGTNDPYEHSGLSYFTRSTSILELISSIN